MIMPSVKVHDDVILIITGIQVVEYNTDANEALIVRNPRLS